MFYFLLEMKEVMEDIKKDGKTVLKTVGDIHGDVKDIKEQLMKNGVKDRLSK